MTAEEFSRLHLAAMPAGDAWQPASFAELMAQATSIVASVPGGFALGRVVADEAELLALAVDPSQQRAGRGTALLSAYEAQAITRGAGKFFLEVAADNEAAIALYWRAGYTRVGHRPAYYARAGGERIDALLLGKSAPAATSA